MDIRHRIANNSKTIVTILGLFGLSVVTACVIACIYRHFNIPAWTVMLTIVTIVIIQVAITANLNRKHIKSDELTVWLKRELNILAVAMWLCLLEQIVKTF